MLFNRFLISVLFLFFCLCTFPATSFNNGKLLLPGESLTTISYGQRSTFEIQGDRSSNYDSNYNYQSKFIPTDTNSYLTQIGALDYRLGVLAKRPLGKGLEIGLLFELPLSGEGESWRALLLQYDVRLGLPMVPLKKSIYHHNVNIGWVVGEWVDNGWFLEYAGGLERGSFTPYCNGRITLTATEVMSKAMHEESYSFGNEKFLTYHKRGWNFRTCAGVSIKLPRLRVLPDFIVPEVTFFYPNGSLKAAGFSWHFGARWLNGF
jgi:hypothetical protein